MTTTLKDIRTNYQTEHITPTIEAWQAFETTATAGKGDSITAYVHYRTLLQRAEKEASAFEMRAAITAEKERDAAMKSVNAHKAELERITTEIRFHESARRPTAGMFADEIEAANTALNEIADSIGSDTHRSANDLSSVNIFTYVKDKPLAGELRSGYESIPNHGSIHNALEHIITQQAK